MRCSILEVYDQSLNCSKNEKMFLKKIVICDFQSFQGEVIIAPLHSNINIIFGSKGKTSLCNAIEFALNITSTFGNESSLINSEVCAGGATSAYVEITVDNANHIIPINASDVVVRHTIVNDQHEFLLNGKKVDRLEIQCLTDYLGFSKSFPYCFYIKPCNISELINANEVKLLGIFKQFVGFDDFARSKEKSMRSIQGTRNELETVKHFLHKIKLQLLIAEDKWNQSNLKKIIDKKLELECLIKMHQLNRMDGEIQDLKNSSSSLTTKLEKFKSNLFNTNNKIKERLAILKDCSNTKLQLLNEAASVNAIKNHLQQTHSNLEKNIEILQIQVDCHRNKMELAEKEFDLIETAIEEKKEEMRNVKDDYNRYQEMHQRYSCQLQSTDQEYKKLFEIACTAEGLTTVFYSVAKRNSWIDDKVAHLNVQIGHANNAVENLSNQLRLEQAQLKNAHSELNQFDAMAKDSNQNSDWLFQEQTLKLEIERLKLEQRQLQASEISTLYQIKLNKNKFVAAEKRFRSIVGQGIFDGIKSVRKIIVENPELATHYHGLVVQQFNFEEQLNKLIEMIGKNNILNHIVDTDETATSIIQKMNRQKLPGSPYFLVMNRMYMPLDAEQNAGDVVNQLKFDVKFRNIFIHIFGNTLICRNMEHALTEAKKKPKIRCATLTGDVVESFGTLSGGYISMNTLRMSAYRNWQNIGNIVQQHNDELAKKRLCIKEIDTQLSLAEYNYKEVLQKIEVYQKSRVELRSNMITLNRKIKCMENQVSKKTDRLNVLQQQMNTKQSKRDEWMALLRRPLLLSDDEAKVTALRLRINDIKLKIYRIAEKLLESSKKSKEIEEFLNESLMTRRNSISNTLATGKKMADELLKLKADREECLIELNGLQIRHCNMLKSIRQVDDKMMATDKEIRDMIIQRKDLQKVIRNFNEEILKIENDLRELKKKGRVTNIQLSSPSAERNTMSIAELQLELQMVQQQIIDFENSADVALRDNLIAFKNQISELKKQKMELLSNEQKIIELMNTNINRSAETFYSMFDMLNSHISKIFRQFYPNETVELILQENLATESTDIDKIIGINIRSSLNLAAPSSSETFAIIALSLILAMQKFSPSSTYIIDSIDELFGITNRNILFRILDKLERSNQIIMTIKHPESISIGHSFFHLSTTRTENLSKSVAEMKLRKNE